MSYQTKKRIITSTLALLCTLSLPLTLISCATNSQDQNNNPPIIPNPKPPVVPDAKPDHEESKPPVTDDLPSKPNEDNQAPTYGSPYGHDEWHHAISNPNYVKDKQNSFLVPETKPEPGTIYPSSPNVPKFAKLQYGKLTNQHQIRNAKMSYSIRVSFAGMGTAWILDYKIPDGVDENIPNFKYDVSNYPTTWYFATNAHVLDHFVDEDQQTTLYPSNEEVTKNIKLAFLNEPNLNTVYNHASNSHGGTAFPYNDPINPKNWRKENLWINPDEITIPGGLDANVSAKKIYMGYDFLTTSPKDFNQHPKFRSGVEEYADFAVLEITFKDVRNYVDGFSTLHTQQITAQQFAKYITNDYANWNPNEQFKYKPADLLNSRHELGNNKLNIVGFPLHDESNAPALFVNRPENDHSPNGSNLATAPHYTTFGDLAVMDNAIGKSSFISYKTVDNVEYATWGLTYPSDYGNLQGGSSGSLVSDDAGYDWGIHYLSDQGASISLAQAFYSEGYDYQGKYGKYNLPAYDLIGGQPGSKHFPLQKNSYRHNLIKLYGNQKNLFRTNLFPNGVNY